MSGSDATLPMSRVTCGAAQILDDPRGGLCVIDIVKYAPFTPVRLFWISDVVPGSSRGGHAHKHCSQFMVCMSGKIRIDAFDGTARQNFSLTRGEFINLVPGIYATETFLVEGTVLLVLCDRPYEEEDYISDEKLLIASTIAASEPR